MTLPHGTEPNDPDRLQPPLTVREREIVDLIAAELPNQQIAEKLFISVRTVENHVSHIFGKLDTTSRAGIARWVHDHRGQSAASAQDGHTNEDLKPDPLAARTDAQLEDFLRRFWIWSGHPSCRKIAARAGGTFSHTTISKLLNDRPGKPPLKLEYVQGLVRGCGGDTLDEQIWAAAWRRIHLREAP
jgi:DNA-binding CsgD family transcriptional regulator